MSEVAVVDLVAGNHSLRYPHTLATAPTTTTSHLLVGLSKVIGETSQGTVDAPSIYQRCLLTLLLATSY